LGPRIVPRRLLRSHDLDKAARKIIEPVTLLNVPMQRRTVKLRQQKNPLQPRIQAITDRNIHDPILPRQRHRRLRPILRQRKKPRPGPSAQNNRNDLTRMNKRSLGW
jgi:hypothetical protein